MKKLLLFFSFAVVTLFAQATEKNKKKITSKNELRNTIIERIGNPGLEVNEEVSVRLFVTEDNKLRIRNITSNSQIAKEYVAHQLHNTNIDIPSSSREVIYELDIVFKCQ